MKTRIRRTVPLSQTLALGQRDSLAKGRDRQWDSSGIVSHKPIQFIALRRDSKRDTCGTAVLKGCPMNLPTWDRKL